MFWEIEKISFPQTKQKSNVAKVLTQPDSKWNPDMAPEFSTAQNLEDFPPTLISLELI